MLITELLARRGREEPERPFVLHEGVVVSYGDFARRVNRMAWALRALGVGRGERVTLALGNSVEYLVAAFGVLRAGAVLNPINPDLGIPELAYLLGHAAPRLVITDPRHLPRLAAPELAPLTAGRRAAFGAPADLPPLERLLAVQPDAPAPVTVGPEDPSTLLYTSGTTGRPKGVVFTHGSTGQAGRHFVEGLGISAADVVLAVTPLFHGNAWGAVGTALAAGAAVAFPRAFSASEFWPLVHRTGATVLYTLGTILAILLARPPGPLERANPLRVVLGLGSAPIRDEVVRRFGIEHLADCFGSTDAGVVTLTPRGAVPRPGSAGPPVAGVAVRIVDAEGRDLRPREVGEIAVRSPHAFREYFRDPAATREALRDGWFYTGDLGYVDESGWLYFVDRKRDIIRRGGENISSVYVEGVLREHPRVAEAAVVGVSDPVLGQELKAFIVPRGPLTARELQAFAAARLAPFQVPRLWEFREALPKTATGRVEKYKLRGEGPPGGGRLLG